jgi:hypothetical protein
MMDWVSTFEQLRDAGVCLWAMGGVSMWMAVKLQDWCVERMGMTSDVKRRKRRRRIMKMGESLFRSGIRLGWMGSVVCLAALVVKVLMLMGVTKGVM